MSKVSDVISKRISASVEVYGVTIEFGKMHLGVIQNLEDQGIKIYEPDEKRSVTRLASIAWELLTKDSRKEFESKELFLEFIDMESQSVVFEALNKALAADSSVGKSEGSKKKK